MATEPAGGARRGRRRSAANPRMHPMPPERQGSQGRLIQMSSAASFSGGRAISARVVVQDYPLHTLLRHMFCNRIGRLAQHPQTAPACLEIELDRIEGKNDETGRMDT